LARTGRSAIKRQNRTLKLGCGTAAYASHRDHNLCRTALRYPEKTTINQRRQRWPATRDQLIRNHVAERLRLDPVHAPRKQGRKCSPLCAKSTMAHGHDTLAAMAARPSPGRASSGSSSASPEPSTSIIRSMTCWLLAGLDTLGVDPTRIGCGHISRHGFGAATAPQGPRAAARRERHARQFHDSHHAASRRGARPANQYRAPGARRPRRLSTREAHQGRRQQAGQLARGRNQLPKNGPPYPCLTRVVVEQLGTFCCVPAKYPPMWMEEDEVFRRGPPHTPPYFAGTQPFIPKEWRPSSLGAGKPIDRTNATVASTSIEYSGLQEAYDHFNRELFDGQLPDVFITYQRKAHPFGYFGADHRPYRQHRSARACAQPGRLHRTQRSGDLLHAVHDQVHVWQQARGQPSKRSYHNKQGCAAKMKAIGVQPSSTGMVGGILGSRHPSTSRQNAPLDRACRARCSGLSIGDHHASNMTTVLGIATPEFALTLSWPNFRLLTRSNCCRFSTTFASGGAAIRL
jgi:hypothetical protein